jgi:hypothetical protein
MTRELAISLSISSNSLKVNEKIKSIHRLRGMLFYLLFVYFCAIISVFIWGFASELLFTTPIFNRIFEVLYIAVLFPALACGIFFRQWRIERGRKRHEQLSSMGRQQGLWSPLPFKPKDSVSLNDFDQHDDMIDDDLNKRLSNPHDNNSTAPPSFPLAF